MLRRLFRLGNHLENEKMYINCLHDCFSELEVFRNVLTLSLQDIFPSNPNILNRLFKGYKVCSELLKISSNFKEKPKLSNFDPLFEANFLKDNDARKFVTVFLKEIEFFEKKKKTSKPKQSGKEAIRFTAFLRGMQDLFQKNPGDDVKDLLIKFLFCKRYLSENQSFPYLILRIVSKLIDKGELNTRNAIIFFANMLTKLEMISSNKYSKPTQYFFACSGSIRKNLKRMFKKAQL